MEGMKIQKFGMKILVRALMHVSRAIFNQLTCN